MAACEYVLVSLPRHSIEIILSRFSVEVVGHHMTEDGFGLVLEGETEQLEACIAELKGEDEAILQQ